MAASAIDVVEFRPDLVDDYFALFDSAFPDNAEWAGCYCTFHDYSSETPFKPELNAALHRRDRNLRLRSGAARGLLAYQAGAPVGWCNVAPRSNVPNLRRFSSAVDRPSEDPAVILCFVVHPAHRATG